MKNPNLLIHIYITNENKFGVCSNPLNTYKESYMFQDKFNYITKGSYLIENIPSYYLRHINKKYNGIFKQTNRCVLKEFANPFRIHHKTDF